MTALDCFVGLLERQGRRPQINANGAGRALCPSHDDHSPSLNFKPADKHPGLIATCRSCPAGLEQMLRDLGASEDETRIVMGRVARRAPEIEREFVYRDAQGVPRYRVVRRPPRAPGGKKIFIQQHRDAATGEWVSGRGGDPFVYRLPETLAALPTTDAVWIAEGEKNVEDLVALGLVATCNPGGAEKWRDAYTAMLPGLKRVVICADNDAPGRRHVQILTGSLRRGGVTDLFVLDFPGVEGRDVSDWLLEQPAAERKARLLDYLKANGHAPSRNGTPPADVTKSPPATGDRRKPRPLTDSGNAERLEDRHGHELRYYEPEKTWLTWSGQAWSTDVFAAVQMSLDTTRSIYAEAARVDDVDQRKAFARWAHRCESESARNAMVSLARGPLRVDPLELDADAWALNVENGIVDLKTGVLGHHRRESMMTKLAPVRFDPNARHEVWDRFLARMVPDLELARFVQRAVGYSITGSTSEERLFFIHGPTASGKSTFMAAIKAVLGPYLETCNFETFLENRNGMAPASADLARLPGVRLALSIEVDEGRKLAVSLLKVMTGRDHIPARHLYGRTFTYAPAFKLWLVANDRPRASATDNALWRRIMMIPFEESLPVSEQDPSVKTMLTEDHAVRAAVLAWAVQGTRMWLAEGLGSSQAVERATGDYRKEQDVVGDFIDECCVCGAALSVTNRDLRRVYDKWCLENGERSLGAKALAERLKHHGFKPGRTMHARGWQGLRLRDSVEQTSFSADDGWMTDNDR
jgi:putative DNA primase/helicase